MLDLIYRDLSERDTDGLINEENFLLFFNLNGLWGQKLFHEFDEDKSQKLMRDEFINGICKCFHSLSQVCEVPRRVANQNAVLNV